MNNTSQETIDIYYTAVPCPYLAWRQYLPDTVYSDNCQEVSHIAAAMEFIKHRDLADREALEEKRYFYLNVEQLLKDENLKRKWSELS